MTNIKKEILKWIGECALIVLSVLLAFVIEGKRQENKEKQELIAALTELKTSFKWDSTVIQVRIFYLRKIDTLHNKILSDIDKKVVNHEVSSLDLYNLVMNYSVKRILNNDNISLLSSDYRTGLYRYDRNLDWINEHYEIRYGNNCNELEDLMFEQGDQVLFTSKFKGLLMKSKSILLEMIDEYESINNDSRNHISKLTTAEINKLRK